MTRGEGTHFFGDGCVAPHGEPCTHESSSGIDQTELRDPGKVWRCDTCGWLHCVVTDERGISRMVPA